MEYAQSLNRCLFRGLWCCFTQTDTLKTGTVFIMSKVYSYCYGRNSVRETVTVLWVSDCRDVDLQTGYRTKTILCMPIYIRGKLVTSLISVCL